MTRIWYVAYGSNLCLERFRCYLAGGRPAGGAREYTGCRDPRDPAGTVPFTMPGGLYFAGRSTVWGGGSAFYDPEADGEVAARGYLLTLGQFSDVVAQETRRPTGTDLAFDGVELPVEGLNYRRVVPLGRRAGVPAVTLTSARRAHQEWATPSAVYLRTIGAGLREAHGWLPDRIGSYLAAARGAAGEWTADRISALLHRDRADAPVARQNVAMTELRIQLVDGDATVQAWRQVHNVVIPTSPLSLDEVRDRAGRFHLEVGYLGDTVVGCTTVRPSPGRPDGPVEGDTPVATVIARVLPAHRRQGLGRKLYASGLAHARSIGAEVIETVVLASNVDGLHFAEAHGFVEVERYVLPGHPVPTITLRRSSDRV